MVAARDPRWILLTETGEYSTLGRHREPDETDVAAAEAALARVGQAGWVAVMSDSVHSGAIPELVMVRPLCGPQSPFDQAVKAFQQKLA